MAFKIKNIELYDLYILMAPLVNTEYGPDPMHPSDNECSSMDHDDSSADDEIKSFTQIQLRQQEEECGMLKE